MKSHNYLKQFMKKLFGNNLYFKNITSKFSDSGIICNSCKGHPQNRPHFFLCEKHSTIFEKLNACFINLKLLKNSPCITPYFYNSILSINHPTNLILISTRKFMYSTISQDLSQLQSKCTLMIMYGKFVKRSQLIVILTPQ